MRLRIAGAETLHKFEQKKRIDRYQGQSRYLRSSTKCEVVSWHTSFVNHALGRKTLLALTRVLSIAFIQKRTNLISKLRQCSTSTRPNVSIVGRASLHVL